MITKGSKIKLVKPMGLFNKIGEICEVVKINEDAVITFKCSLGMGCMSYNELDKYFEVCDNAKIKNKPKRTWNNWVNDVWVYFDKDGRNYKVPVKYRNNGKQVQLRTDWNYESNIQVKASCNKTDEFDLDLGLDIADHRMQIKLLQRDLEIFLDDLD